MEDNYQLFINYLNQNKIHFDQNEAAKLIRFGYNIEVGTIEIVADFEHDKRIGFFSFLDLSVPDDRKIAGLELVNYFNESLNYGCIIISQTHQLVYKIMYSIFENKITDEQWAEIIFRLWTISRDIYPLFSRLIQKKEEAFPLFQEFLKEKEKLNHIDHSSEQQDGDSPKTGDKDVLGKDLNDWYLQN